MKGREVDGGNDETETDTDTKTDRNRDTGRNRREESGMINSRKKMDKTNW